MKALKLYAKKEPRGGYELSDFEKKMGKVVEGSKVWRYPEPSVEEVK